MVHSTFSCPFLVRFIDHIIVDGHFIGLQPFFPIAELKSFNLPEAFYIRYACQILSALEALHTLGYDHGDVKPENIMIDEKGNAVLIIKTGS